MARKMFACTVLSSLVVTTLAFSCIKKAGGSEKDPGVVQVSKVSALPGKLPVEPQAPIAPNQARVVLSILRIYPEVESSGPCSQAPCKAEAKILQVQGYGSAFGSPLADGQKVQVYFPATVNPGTGQPQIKEGTILQAELRSPLAGGPLFTVKEYSLR